jgi:gluconolactonase
LFTSPVSYFYDGIRVSGEGWVFAGSGDGVDVIDPESGFVLGSIRLGGGENVAVSLAFGENELWIVGKGGVWHVKDIKTKLKRDW